MIEVVEVEFGELTDGMVEVGFDRERLALVVVWVKKIKAKVELSV